ncbi:MAG TPA: class C beta-lactamase-related serine hydrolase [Bacteroidetes bacterium]|nr:class C beta-lactamase-related serine hydrolase [Bacteroidota bacterium]
MNHFKSIVQLTVLFILLWMPANSQAQNGQLAHVTDKYDPYFKDMGVGFSVMVRKGQHTEVASLGAFDYDEHTTFNIGSGTKAFTAILILQEEEKGHLALTDSIGKYLSPIKNVDGSLSILTLLHHESGLGELVGAGYEKAFFTTHDSLYATNFLDQIPPGDTSKVGTFSYCNTNYILLGHILEKVTDQYYFDLLQDRIFTPCGMQNTYPYLHRQIPNLAHPTQGGKDVFDHLNHRFFAQYAFSAGSIASTLADMEKYYAHLFTQTTLLSPASLKKMLEVGESNYGLGIMKMELHGKTYYGHGGNNLGYAYRDYYNPETKEIVLLFVNSERVAFGKRLKDELIAYVHGEAQGPVFREDNVAHFQAFTGKYTLDDIGLEFELKVIEGELNLLIQGASLILLSSQDNVLFTAEFGVELEVQPTQPDVLLFRQGRMATTASKESL